MGKFSLFVTLRVGVLLAVIAVAITACASQPPGAMRTVTKTAAAVTLAPAPAAARARAVAPAKPRFKPIHIQLKNEDGATYGVGMPLIAYFSRRMVSAKALEAATTASVDGRPVHGAWYFEFSNAGLKNYPIEGHYRLQGYWPAHSRIHIGVNAKGVSAGGGYAYDDSLMSDWTTGPANFGLVNDITKRLSITSDGKPWGTFKISLGLAATPTAHGIKVIMEKGRSICMSGPGYDECGIKFTQRLTYGGEYLHAAPWNHRLGQVDSSNGCTNLSPKDAERLYRFLRIGDVVSYPNANGPAMMLATGYGDWNLSWEQWQTGGLISTAV